jgi:hypothetical protein
VPIVSLKLRPDTKWYVRKIPEPDKEAEERV